MTLEVEWFSLEEVEGAARCLRADVLSGSESGNTKTS